MNELELRLRVQGMVQQWIESFMYNNQVSATMMEDALNKVLLNLKDKANQEFIAAVTQPVEPPQTVEESADGGSK